MARAVATEAVDIRISLPLWVARIDRSVVPTPRKGPTVEGDRRAAGLHSLQLRLIDRIAPENTKQGLRDFAWDTFLRLSGRVEDIRQPTDNLVLFGRFHIPFRVVSW